MQITRQLSIDSFEKLFPAKQGEEYHKFKVTVNVTLNEIRAFYNDLHVLLSGKIVSGPELLDIKHYRIIGHIPGDDINVGSVTLEVTGTWPV